MIQTNDKSRFLQALRATRAGYQSEGLLHNFLIDSYTGGGGFQNGLIPSPDVPLWGRRAYERQRDNWLEARSFLSSTPLQGEGAERGEAKRASQSQWSYLVAFHGEDQDSYNDRLKNSAYHNPIEKIVRVTNGFLFQTPPVRDNLPELLARWVPQVDLKRRHMDSHLRTVGLRMQILGWSGTLVDLPKMQADNMLDSFRRGLLPYCMPLYPQEILDMDVSSGGELKSIKIQTMHEHERSSMLVEKQWEEHITIYYPDRWERWRLLLAPPSSRDSGYHDAEFITPPGSPEYGPNPFGVVPATFASWDDGLGGLTSWGMPQIFNLAKIAWQLYNQGSELENILRNQTFATLVIPKPEGNSVKGNITIGVGNAIKEPEKAKGLTRYISPSASSATVYETRLNSGGERIHAIAGIDSGNGKYSETAEAMRIRFQQTEMMLINASNELQRHEQEILKLAGRGGFHVSEPELDRIQVFRSKEFDVDRYASQLTEATKAMKLPWPEQVMTGILKRTVRSVLPNASQKELAGYDAEIERTMKAVYPKLLSQLLSQIEPDKTDPAAAPKEQFL